jgi:molybdopterin-biosynthesis enzyme MoeA-like protein
VYVLPGLPAEMEAMYELVEPEIADAAAAIVSWHRTYATTESRIVEVLRELERRWPTLRVGSYPTFTPAGSTVEVVLKSSNPADLAAASTWAETALSEAATRA